MEQVRTMNQEITDRLQSTVSSLSSVCDNTFLQETPYNSDIDESIREEIESKYRKSKVNSHYVFPRQQGASQSRKRSSTSMQRPLQSFYPTPIKQRLTLEKSLPIIHKGLKSQNDSMTIYPKSKSRVSNTSYKKIKNYALAYENTNSEILKRTSSKQISPKRIPTHLRTKSDAVRSRTPVYVIRSRSPDRTPLKNTQTKGSIKSLSRENPYKAPIKATRIPLKSSQHHYSHSMEDFVYIPVVHYGK
ncbi:unnamed protein product [Blepharisma stoltei]|uniref:Uncharacterized protein n=1 Tax=Blepharisma stoltei TaxID=1481888 RepID=A0AAU9JXN0_9CILI|nr:unnamed protein product [Blepharisma stoltei]